MIGDFAKALVAGADICMSGAFFAGCDEAAGDIIEKMYRTNEYTACEDIDANGNRILVEDKPMKEVEKEFFDYVVAVASGEKVCSEKAGFHDFAIFKQGVTL